MKAEWYDAAENYIRNTPDHALSGIEISDLPKEYRNNGVTVTEIVIEEMLPEIIYSQSVRKWIRDTYDGVLLLCKNCNGSYLESNGYDGNFCSRDCLNSF